MTGAVQWTDPALDQASPAADTDERGVLLGEGVLLGVLGVYVWNALLCLPVVSLLKLNILL